MRWLKNATEVADTFTQNVDRAIRERAGAVAKRRQMEAVSKEDIYIAIGELLGEGSQLKELLLRFFTEK